MPNVMAQLSHLFGSPWLYLREWHNMVLGSEWSRRFPRALVLTILFALSGCAYIVVDCYGTTGTCGATSAIDAMTSVPNPSLNLSAIPSI